MCPNAAKSQEEEVDEHRDEEEGKDAVSWENRTPEDRKHQAERDGEKEE